jgi:hypothetical protein
MRKNGGGSARSHEPKKKAFTNPSLIELQFNSCFDPSPRVIFWAVFQEFL